MTASEVRSEVCSVVGTASQTYFSELFIFFLGNYKKVGVFIVLACKVIK